MCLKVLKIAVAKSKPLNQETINSPWELVLFSGATILDIPQLSSAIVGVSNRKT